MCYRKVLLHVKVCYASRHRGRHRKVAPLGEGSLPQKREMRLPYDNSTEKYKNGGGKGVKAGELGYENYLPIMRINNHICSWPFSLPNQINHHRSP